MTIHDYLEEYILQSKNPSPQSPPARGGEKRLLTSASLLTLQKIQDLIIHELEENE